jgi:hypothetical protein
VDALARGIERPFIARRVIFTDRGGGSMALTTMLIGCFKPRDVFALAKASQHRHSDSRSDIVRHGIEDQWRASLYSIRGREHDRHRIDVVRNLGGVLCLRNRFGDDTDNGSPT